MDRGGWPESCVQHQGGAGCLSFIKAGELAQAVIETEEPRPAVGKVKTQATRSVVLAVSKSKGRRLMSEPRQAGTEFILTQPFVLFGCPEDWARPPLPGTAVCLPRHPKQPHRTLRITFDPSHGHTKSMDTTLPAPPGLSCTKGRKDQSWAAWLTLGHRDRRLYWRLQSTGRL